MTYDLDTQPRKLLTRSNPKVLKGEKLGYLTGIMHLAPAELAGFNVCAHSSAGCRAACLNTAGHGGMGLDENGLNSVQVARIRRTRYWRAHRIDFNRMLHREISNLVKRANRDGMTPAIRLNGTSDLPWERLKHDQYPNIMQAFPDVQFYDYTKWPVDKRGDRATGNLPNNYHLTFSLSESNDTVAAAALEAGYNVAAVLAVGRNGDLPETWSGYPVIDGDVSDVRFDDTGGHIVALRAKGDGIGDESGFVRPSNGALRLEAVPVG